MIPHSLVTRELTDNNIIIKFQNNIFIFVNSDNPYLIYDLWYL